MLSEMTPKSGHEMGDGLGLRPQPLRFLTLLKEKTSWQEYSIYAII